MATVQYFDALGPNASIDLVGESGMLPLEALAGAYPNITSTYQDDGSRKTLKLASRRQRSRPRGPNRSCDRCLDGWGVVLFSTGYGVVRADDALRIMRAALKPEAWHERHGHPLVNLIRAPRGFLGRLIGYCG
jgi:hypothetical protein